MKATGRHILECKNIGNIEIMQCVQNKCYENSGPREPGTLEWKFFVSCLNSFKHISVKQKSRTKKSSTHGFLRKCQPSACQRFPGGTEKQEPKGAVPGQEDGKDRADKRVSMFLDPVRAVQNAEDL